jgi:hypothetical protein
MLRGERFLASHAAPLFTVEPAKDDSGAHQQIVLAVIDRVAEAGQIVIDLHESNCELATHRYINAATHARGKSKGSIACASVTTAGMPGSYQQLDEGLHTVALPHPWLREGITGSGQIGSHGQRVPGGGQLSCEASADFRHYSQPGTDIPGTGDAEAIQINASAPPWLSIGPNPLVGNGCVSADH